MNICKSSDEYINIFMVETIKQHFLETQLTLLPLIPLVVVEYFLPMLEVVVLFDQGHVDLVSLVLLSLICVSLINKVKNK